MGSLIAGYLFDSIGGGHTFEIFGVAAFVAFIIHVCLQMYLQRHHSSSDNENGKPITGIETGENVTLKTEEESGGLNGEYQKNMNVTATATATGEQQTVATTTDHNN